MFVGHSPEEKELAGEEVGFSLGDVWKKVISFARTPQGAAVSTLFLPAPVAAALAAGQARKASPKAKAAPAEGPPDGSSAPSSSSSPSGPGSSGPPSSDSSEGSWMQTARHTGRGFLMGADAPMNDADIHALIAREKDPRKRNRMIENFERARERRGW
jgi:hypothetical protein